MRTPAEVVTTKGNGHDLRPVLVPSYRYIFIHLSTVSSIWIRTHAAAKPICFLGRMLQQSSGRRVDLHRRPFPWECNDCRNPTSSYIGFLNVGFGIPFPAAALVAQTYTLRVACNCDQHVDAFALLLRARPLVAERSICEQQ